MAHFRFIFPIFEAKKFFQENLALPSITSYGFLAPCQNLEKFNDTIPEKHPDRDTEGWKDRRKDERMNKILFHSTLPATARGLIKPEITLKTISRQSLVPIDL